MLMKTQKVSANRQERKPGTCGGLRLAFYPAAASPAQRRRARRADGRRRWPFKLTPLFRPQIRTSLVIEA